MQQALVPHPELTGAAFVPQLVDVVLQEVLVLQSFEAALDAGPQEVLVPQPEEAHVLVVPLIVMF